MGCDTPDPDCDFPPGDGGGHGGQPGPATGEQLRLLTYNLRHAENDAHQIKLDQVVARLDDAAPDLACLQEVDRGAIRTNFVDQAAYLSGHASDLPYSVYVPVGTYDEITQPMYTDKPDGQYYVDLYESSLGVTGERGIAVLSRYPILSVAEWPFDGDFQPRSIVSFFLEVPDVGLVLGYCTHFPVGTGGHAGRTEMITWLNAQANLAIPTFLLGDLNAFADSDEIDDLEAVWRNPTPSPVLTIPASAPTEQRDYVMSHNGGAFSVKAAVVSGAQPSDHLPLLATYTLP